MSCTCRVTNNGAFLGANITQGKEVGALSRAESQRAESRGLRGLHSRNLLAAQLSSRLSVDFVQVQIGEFLAEGTVLSGSCSS